MFVLKKLADSNAQGALQKLDYVIGVAFIAWGAIAGPWWLMLLGGIELVMAYLNVGKVLGEKIARAFLRKTKR